MIFERRYDQQYYRWFAWRPVQLNGPDEWDRMRRLDARARWVWLRFVWRMRAQPSIYYALPDEDSRNNLLLTSTDCC